MIKKLVFLIIILGMFLRIAEYLSNRSLWVDEAALSLDIVNLSPLELLRPEQAAPYGFLLLEKLAITVFGDTEYSLRFFPVLFGISSLVIFYFLCQSILPKKAVLIALTLFALYDPLIYYSSEVKQYGGDVIVALLIEFTLLKYLRKKNLAFLDWVMLATVGIVSVWFSHPATFVLAGMGSIILFFFIKRKEWKNIVKFCLVCLSWLVSFSVYYFLSLQFISQKKLPLFVQSDFAPPPISFPALEWYPGALINIFTFAFQEPYYWVWIFFFLVGVLRLYKQNKTITLILISPLLPTLLASGIQKYPFFDRFLLFFIPAITIFIGEGIYEIIKICKQKNRYLTIFVIITIGFFFLQIAYLSFSNFIKPRKVEEIRPIMQFLQKNKIDGDIVYVYYASELPFTYYAPKYGINLNNHIKGVDTREKPSNYIFDLRKLRGNKRVWFVFSHVISLGAIDEEKFFLNYLDQIGTKIDSYHDYGAAIYLYDLTLKQ